MEGVHKGGNAPFGIKLYNFLPLPRQRGDRYFLGMGAGGGRGWASHVLSARQARAGRYLAPPLGELSPQATERAPFKKGGCQRGAARPPLELNYITFSPSRTVKVQVIAIAPLREGAGGGAVGTAGQENPYAKGAPGF